MIPFVDDINAFLTGADLRDVEQKLNNELKTLVACLQANRLK